MTESVLLAGGGAQAFNLGTMIEARGHSIVGYADVNERDLPWPYLGDDASVRNSGLLNKIPVAIAVGTDSALRYRVFATYRDAGARIFSIVLANAYVCSDAELGAGAIVFPLSYIGPGAALGINVFIGPGAIVEHGTSVGDHSYLAPGATLGGNVNIGANCMIGLNATIKDGTSVADWSLIGAGATVVKPISDPGGVWAGSPARKLRSIPQPRHDA